MDTTIAQPSFETRCQQVLQVARDFYHRNPDWVTFFREILGVDGAARRSFVEDEFVAFEQTDEYALIQKMVSSLRARKNPAAANEPTRVITVRLPESLHEALKAEANDHNTSMNKLCISKLLQVLQEAENNARANQQNQMNNRQSNLPSSYVPSPNPMSSSPMSSSPMSSNTVGSNLMGSNPPIRNEQPNPSPLSSNPMSSSPLNANPAQPSPMATEKPVVNESAPQPKPTSQSNYTPTQFKPRFNNQGY